MQKYLGSHILSVTGDRQVRHDTQALYKQRASVKCDITGIITIYLDMITDRIKRGRRDYAVLSSFNKWSKLYNTF